MKNKKEFTSEQRIQALRLQLKNKNEELKSLKSVVSHLTTLPPNGDYLNLIAKNKELKSINVDLQRMLYEKRFRIIQFKNFIKDILKKINNFLSFLIGKL